MPTVFELLDLNPWREEKVEEEAFVAILKENPELAKKKYQFDAFDDELYALHMVSALGATLDCIKMVYKAHPEAIKYADPDLGGPLHFACAFGATVDVVRYLAKKDPDAMEASNSADKQTPLHLACQNSADSDVVIFLTEKCPKAARKLDCDHRTPLFLAASVDEPILAVIEDLTEVYGEAGVIKDNTGSWPLWKALKYTTDLAILKDLIVSNPESVELTAKDGTTVLHKAITNEVPFSIIKDMVKVFPEALLMNDAENRIPLHLAIELKANFELIKHLVKKCPETVEKENTQGEIAFKMADRLGWDEESVEFLNPFEEVPAQ